MKTVSRLRSIFDAASSGHLAASSAHEPYARTSTAADTLDWVATKIQSTEAADGKRFDRFRGDFPC